MFKRSIFAALILLSVSGAVACGSSSTTPTAVLTSQLAYVSRIQEKGSAWRSFQVLYAGSVTVQLTSVSQTDAVMGLGLGTVVGTNCSLTQQTQTAASAATSTPQITATLPVGSYCVKVSDIGNLTSYIDFTILVTYPAQ
jgi:hypothetical protein